MPDAQEHLREGLRAERAGALDLALQAYRAAAAASNDPANTAEAYTRIADVYRERCQWVDAIDAARRAQSVAKAAGLDVSLANARIAEGNVLMIQGEFAAALPIFRQVADSHADPRLRGIALQNVGSILAQLGQHGAAERAFGESLGNFYKAGYGRGQAIALNNLGRLAIDRGAADEATSLLARALVEAKASEDAELEALAGQNMAAALFRLGRAEEALPLAESALAYFTDCRNHYREIECLRLIAQMQERSGDVAAARASYERALVLAEAIESEVEVRVTRHQLERLRGAPKG